MKNVLGAVYAELAAMLPKSLEDMIREYAESGFSRKSGLGFMEYCRAAGKESGGRIEPEPELSWCSRNVPFGVFLNAIEEWSQKPEGSLWDWLREKKNIGVPDPSWPAPENPALPDRHILSEYGISPESFADYLIEEYRSTEGRPNVADDIRECREAVEELDAENRFERHPWFTNFQSAILDYYLDGEFSHALRERTRQEALDVTAADGLLACMLCACDGRMKSWEANDFLSGMEKAAERFERACQFQKPAP